MYCEDYILRLVQQLVAAIARIAGLNQRGAHDEALAVADRAWCELLDVPREMLDAMDTPSLAAMLREPAKLRLAARLFVEEAHALASKGDPRLAAARLRRALELFLEVHATDPSEQDDAAIRDLLRVVPVEILAPRYRAHAGAAA